MPAELLTAHISVGINQQPGEILMQDPGGRLGRLLWPDQDLPAAAQRGLYGLGRAEDDIGQRCGAHVAQWGLIGGERPAPPARVGAEQ
jgi:hypothetical protein